MRVVSSIVYGVCVAPCVSPYYVPLSSLPTIFSLCTLSFTTGRKSSPLFSLFFLPKCGNDISVCLLRSQQTGRWSSIFLRCPLFLYSWHKDLIFVPFFCSSSRRSCWKIYTSLQRTGIRGLVHVIESIYIAKKDKGSYEIKIWKWSFYLK